MGSNGDPAPLSERVERILGVLYSIGPGEVVTYGDIAEDAGYPRQSRFVGRVLATTDADVDRSVEAILAAVAAAR